MSILPYNALFHARWNIYAALIVVLCAAFCGCLCAVVWVGVSWAWNGIAIFCQVCSTFLTASPFTTEPSTTLWYSGDHLINRENTLRVKIMLCSHTPTLLHLRVMSNAPSYIHIYTPHRSNTLARVKHKIPNMWKQFWHTAFNIRSLESSYTPPSTLYLYIYLPADVQLGEAKLTYQLEWALWGKQQKTQCFPPSNVLCKYAVTK